MKQLIHYWFASVGAKIEENCVAFENKGNDRNDNNESHTTLNSQNQQHF
jgi:hypothetical protein